MSRIYYQISNNELRDKADGKEKKELRWLYNEKVSEIVRLLDKIGQ